MSRTYLTPEYDEYGDAIDTNRKWFDYNKAKEFKADTYWNGQNLCDVNTRSQWEHEELLLTSAGNWILHTWSQWEGTQPTFKSVLPSEAAAWLLFNGYTSRPAEYNIPPDVLQLMAEIETETEV